MNSHGEPGAARRLTGGHGTAVEARRGLAGLGVARPGVAWHGGRGKNTNGGNDGHFRFDQANEHTPMGAVDAN